jgi:mannose-1-phosphate guanylyltransferase
MFVWRSDVLLDEVRRYAPDIHSLLYEGDTLNPPERFFAEVKSISIDFAVMEKTPNILVIEARYDWIDVGSYSSLYRILPKDGDANAYRDGVPGVVDSSKNLVISGDKRVILVGVEGVGVVVEGDTVLVVNLKEDQKVREAAKRYG